MVLEPWPHSNLRDLNTIFIHQSKTDHFLKKFVLHCLTCNLIFFRTPGCFKVVKSQKLRASRPAHPAHPACPAFAACPTLLPQKMFALRALDAVLNFPGINALPNLNKFKTKQNKLDLLDITDLGSILLQCFKNKKFLELKKAPGKKTRLRKILS